ncbi:MAG: hypothetical protein JRC86_00810 [Deltaproteobacteria bacterium]|nr:hypothetical protein [Deltaproteobacteria bacterium]
MAIGNLVLKVRAEQRPCDGDGEKCEGCGDLRFLPGIDYYVYVGDHLGGIIKFCQSCGDCIK